MRACCQSESGSYTLPMAAPINAGPPAWSLRLPAELDANDQRARDLVAGLSREQLNWQPHAGSWSIGQCLEHVCIAGEVYLVPVKTALAGKPRSPVKETSFGWFARS